MKRSRLAVVCVLGALVALVVESVAPTHPAQAEVDDANRNGRLDWIALGDSYSAGVGVGPVGGGCDRDRHAYATRADRHIFGRKRDVRVRNVACSGAKVRDVRRRQLRHVRPGHEVATITVGGNDINFGSRVKKCIKGRCGSSTFRLSASPTNWDSLYTRLWVTYRKIRKRMSRNGYLYVLTYPIPFALQTGRSCGPFGVFRWDEQQAANALVTRLDDTIYWAVRKANRVIKARDGRPGNVVFVDWRNGRRRTRGYVVPRGVRGAGRRYSTYTSSRGLCNRRGRVPYVQGIKLALPAGWANPLGNTMHPNTTGYWRAAVLVSGKIRQRQP